MKNLKTSIIILTKNRALLLERNLSSLTKQTIKPDEVIIIDNDSNDQTPNIIKKYKKFLPIKVFRTKTSGYPRLYNLGIEKTRGELICFLDDDCFVKNDWLEKIIKSYRKNPDCVIQGQTFSVPKDNIYAQIMGDHYQNWLRSNLINENKLKVLDNKNVAIPKKILTKYGGFSENFLLGSEDIELGIRLRKKGVEIFFEPKAIAWHYERTTLKEFINQHYRIAQSEAFLDRILKRDKIGILPKKKTILNLKSAIKRETEYITRGNIINAFQLPFIYLLLFIIRIIGYLRKKYYFF